MALTEGIASTTSATLSAAKSLSGPTVVVISKGVLTTNEKVYVWGEDADGAFTEELHTFKPNTQASVLIETYRDVKFQKTATEAALAVGYGS